MLSCPCGRRLWPPGTPSALSLTIERAPEFRPASRRVPAHPLTPPLSDISEGTFRAEVVIDGTAGGTQVDARPSDAMNLALVADVPIRVDADLLDDGEAIRHNAWQDFPARAPDLAAEVRQRQDDLQAMLAQYQRTGRWGTEP